MKQPYEIIKENVSDPKIARKIMADLANELRENDVVLEGLNGRLNFTKIVQQ